MARKKTSDMKWMLWTARIWGSIVLLFALIIFIDYFVSWLTTGVADPHAVEGYPFIENLPPIFMALGAIGLGVAWKWEQIGGAISAFFNIITIPIIMIHWGFEARFIVAPYGVWVLFTVPGVLFLVHWYKKDHKR